jgi:hypothetical protein
MEEQDQGCKRTSGNNVALRETIQRAEVRRYMRGNMCEEGMRWLTEKERNRI